MTPEEFEQIYKQNKDLNWNYDFLSSCPYISWSIVRNNLGNPWNFKKLSANQAITWEMVDDTPFLVWDWIELSKNPNMTFEIIKENIGYNWDFRILYERFSDEQMDVLYKEKDYYNSLDHEYYSDSECDGYDSF